MDAHHAMSLEGVEPHSLHAFTQKAYRDYAMYVILDRALPSIGDGLKPVQRRIIYAMSELGLSHVSKPKKSARTVGDVLGKYHPHGDTACYEAMVLMAQPFSYRYPMIQGQGNWGSTDDPKSFAAMRYTEAKLSPYAKSLLAELDQGTVDWQPNFDGTMNEPVTLPAQVPNVLLNGGTGIAVGMATDIPPHNLREVVDACLHLIKHPSASTDKLMQFIQGPDFPTEAEVITPHASIKQLYETGIGSIRQRAVYHLEEGEIVITALPYQVSGAKLLEQIAAQMQAKKLPMVTDLKDESDEANPIRIVITPRSNRVDVPGVMSHLFATTDLEKSYRANFNMIGLDGRPQVKNLRDILNEWLSYRFDVVTRRLETRLEKVLDRLHILDGLMIAYLNIDEVIQIIREYDDPKAELMKRFSLTDVQAHSVLELKLRFLAKLEEVKIKAEQDELAKERDGLEHLLGHEEALKQFVADELKEAKKLYGDNRRSPIVAREGAQAINFTEMLPVEPVTIVLSKLGWVRCAKGHDVDGAALSYKTGDAYLSAISAKSNQKIAFLDSSGRSYTTLAQDLPSARGQGEPLSGRFQLPSHVRVEHMLSSPEASQRYLMATSAGFGFICEFEHLQSKNKAGKALVSLSEGAHLLPPVPILGEEGEVIVLITQQGRALLVDVAACPNLVKGKGNMLVKIQGQDFKARQDELSLVASIAPGQTLILHSGTGKRQFKLDFDTLSVFRGERGRRGGFLRCLKSGSRVIRVDSYTRILPKR